MKFIVLGRKFNKRLHAITFAQGQACELGQSVDVKVETTDFLYRKQRSWVCRMHPPDMKQTVLKPAPRIPHLKSVAV